MKWKISIFSIILILFCTSLTVKSQDIVLDDSTFLVYPAKINQSDSIFSAVPVKAENLTFNLKDDFVYDQLPYTLIMIVEVKTYAFTYYQLEFAKGKGMSKRKTIIMNYKGIIIKEQEHIVYSF